MSRDDGRGSDGVHRQRSTMLDAAELADGWSTTGTRGRGIFDWQTRQDDRAFAALCVRLRWRKWHADQMASDPDYRATKARRHREHQARYRAARSPAVHAAKLANRRAVTLATWQDAAPVHTCRVCRSTFCNVPWLRRGRHPGYCSPRCSGRAYRGRIRVSKQAARLATWKAAAPVHTCRVCRSTYCNVPWLRGGRPPAWCSRRCREVDRRR